MKNIKLLLILLINCALILPIKSEIPVFCPKDPCFTRIFFYDSNNFAYAREPQEKRIVKDPTFIKSSYGENVQAFDYHSEKNLLFWVKSQNKFDENGKLFAMEWDYRKVCIIGNNNYISNFYGCNDHTHEFRSDNMRILREEDWNPRSIAVDYVTDKLYIVDTGESSVNVYDLEGNNKTTVFENESFIPLEVVLDPSEGLMFVLVVKRRTGILQIYRINMDGSEPQLIVDNADVMEKFYQNARFGFALDVSKKRIYFGNFEKEIIETVNYFRNERLTVTNIKNPQSLSIYNGTLYSMSPVSYNRVNKCYYLTCKLNNIGSCIEDTKQILPCPENIKTEAIKAINSNSVSPIKNPCGDNRGGCEHHCLLKPSNTAFPLDYSCVCNSGYKLEPNQKNCTYTKIFSAYDQVYVSEKKNFVDSWDLFSTENIFPISKNLLIRLIYNDFGNDFNNIPSYIYDNKNAAYDWITKNIYSLRSRNYFNSNNEYDLILEKDKVNRNDKEEPNVSISLAKIEEPVFMAIHPYRGYLFIVLKGNGSVLRFNTDGSGQTLLPNINNSITLAIDFNEDRLYWLDKNSTAWYSDLNGQNTKEIFKSISNDFNFMYIYDNYLYVKNENDKKIWRYNKISGKVIGSLDFDDNNFYRETVGMKVSAKDAQLVNATDHPCAINNGGCERFCFGVPETKNGSLKRVCACSDEDVHIYGAKCRVPNKNLRLLFYGKHYAKYAIGYSPQLYELYGPNTLIDSVANKSIAIYSIDYHPGKNTLFWISFKHGHREKIQKLFSAKLDDNFFGDEKNVSQTPDIELLRVEENWSPRSLAVDYIGNKLYIADLNTNSIIVLNLDGTNKTIIFKNETLTPIEVKVDPFSGLMFILTINAEDKVLQIYRLKMDGTEAHLIVPAINDLKIRSAYDKTGFTIDIKRRKVYFVDAKNKKIECRSYEGYSIPIIVAYGSYSSREHELYVAKADNPYNLYLYKDTLYWAEAHGDESDSNSLLKSCKLNDDGLCIKDSIKLIFTTKNKDFLLYPGEFYGIKPIDRYEYEERDISNP